MRVLGGGLRQLSRALRPTYVVHRIVETVEADLQPFHLTGCRLAAQRPALLKEKEMTLDASPFLLDVLRSIVVARNFEEEKVEKDGPPPSYASSLLFHLLRVVFSQARSHQQLRDLHLAIRVPVCSDWLCQGQHVAVRGYPGDMLLSRQPLPNLFSEQERTSATPVAMPTQDLFSGLKQFLVGEMEEEGEGENLFPHLHTLLLVDRAGVAEVQLLQKALLFTFGRLVRQAVQCYGKQVHGQQLPTPQNGQCVVTDGQRVSFLWVQLNTLNLEAVGGDGGGNVVCVHRPGLLYSGTEMVGGRRKRRVLDLREDILNTLLATILLH